MSPDSTSRGLLTAANDIRRAGAERDPWLAGLRLAGIGWATVELERAAEELARAFAAAGLPEPDWVPAPRDGLLGAMAWVGASTWFGGAGPPRGPSDPEMPRIVLLEPDTEGRLAATLARFAEGAAAIYLEAPRDPEPGAAPSPYPFDPARLGAPAPGPLGSGRIVLARPAWGPHIVVVTRSRGG